MRRKTSILAAAALAAGAIPSTAQTNVIDYVNIAIPHGYSLIANQLNNGNNNIQTVLGLHWVSGTQVLSWIPATQSFGSGDTFYDFNATGGTAPAGWYDANFNPSTRLLNSGTSFFLNNAGSSTNVILVGQVTQGTNSVAISQGYAFLSIIPPVAVDLATNGPLALPHSNGAQVLTFNNAANTYTNVATYIDILATEGPDGWYDSNYDPAQIIPSVGQGFDLVWPPFMTTWTQTFGVQ